MSEADEKAIVWRLKFYGGILDRLMGDEEEWIYEAGHYLDTFLKALMELPEEAKDKEEFLRKAVVFLRQEKKLQWRKDDGFDKATSPEEPVTSVEYCEQDVPRQCQVKSCVSEQETEDTECLREVAQGVDQSEEEDMSLEALFSTGTEDIDWCNEATQVMDQSEDDVMSLEALFCTVTEDTDCFGEATQVTYQGDEDDMSLETLFSTVDEDTEGRNEKTQVMNQFEEDDMSLEALFDTVTEDTDGRNEESQVKDCDPLCDQEPDKEMSMKVTPAMDRVVFEPMVAMSAMVLEQDGVTSKSEEANLEKQMVETEPSEMEAPVDGLEETQEIVSGREPKSEPVKVMEDGMVNLVDADVTQRKVEKATVIELVGDGKSFAEELGVIWKRKDRGPPDLDWKRRKKTLKMERGLDVGGKVWRWVSGVTTRLSSRATWLRDRAVLISLWSQH